MSKTKVITFLILSIFFISTLSYAASFGFKTETVRDVICEGGGSIFNAKKLGGKSYSYPFWTSKTGIKDGKTVLGMYKKTDSSKCYKTDEDGNKEYITVYLVDKIGVSR